MKTAKKMAAQGDVLFRKVTKASIPNTAKLSEDLIIAHSETGHHHTVDGVNVKVWRLDNDPMVCYLQISEPYADIVHHRTFDTHETVRLLKGTWEIRRQREHSPEGWRMVAD